jgi:hypothetical protein
LIIRPRTDQPSIDEIISERATIKIERAAPWRLDMTVTEGDEARQFPYRSSNHRTPLQMSVELRMPPEADYRHHAEAEKMEGTGSLHSEQMDEVYYRIGVQAGTEGEHEVTVDTRTDPETSARIICEELR